MAAAPQQRLSGHPQADYPCTMNAPAVTRPASARRLSAVIFGAVLILGVLLLWATRAPLATWAIEDVMNDQGLCPCEVEVVTLGLSHSTLRLHRSALGTVARIDVDYGVGDEVDQLIERLRIEGANLTLAWHDGKLSPLLATRTGAGHGAGAFPLARIEVVDSRISLSVDSTLVVATFAGTVERDPQLTGNLELTVQAPQGQLHGNVQVHALQDGAMEALFVIKAGDVTVESLAVRGVMGTLRAVAGAQGLTALDGKFSVAALNTLQQAWGGGTVSVVQSPDAGLSLLMQFAPLRLALRGTTLAPTSGATFSLDGELDARALAGVLPGFVIDSGAIKFAGSGTLANKSTNVRALFNSARMRAEVHAELGDVTATDHTHITHVAADLNCALAAGTLACFSPQGLHLDGIALPVTLVPADHPLARISTVQVSAPAGAPLLALTAADGGDKLTLTSSVFLQSQTLAVHGPLALSIMLAANPPGTASQPRQGQYSVHSKLVVERPPGQQSLAPELALDGHFSVAAQHGTLLAATIDQGRLDLPDQAWLMHGVRARYSAGATQQLKLTVDDLRNARAPALVAPLRADLEARIVASEVRFTAHLNDGSGLINATLKGRHERRSGVGEAHLDVVPVVFSHASTLSELSPALAARGFKARGTLTSAARFHWGEGSPRAALSLAVQSFALGGPGFKASAVNGALELDSLAPLHSVAGQQINGVLELPSVKRVPFSLRFALDADQLLIEQARAELFGGAFETTAAQIDLKTTALRMDLRVLDIDLEAAFTVLDLEQLKGSGRIGGLLPLRLSDGHLAVTAGHLAAAGPGTVRIGASSVTEQLKSHGPDVDLALRVLSDFHYQRLRIDVDKALLGEGTAMFHLEGNNPTVMQNQPFVFNISLETDFDYLAKLLLELSATTNHALGWGAGELIKQ